MHPKRIENATGTGSETAKDELAFVERSNNPAMMQSADQSVGVHLQLKPVVIRLLNNQQQRNKPMPPFIVTFDLVKKESSPDYRPLIRDLLRRGAHKYQPSCWLINVANTAAEVYEYFRQFLYADDRLMVSELTNNYKLDRKFKGASDWIENNPPVR